jgi:ssDNA-binding replication factor A large subunit
MFSMKEMVKEIAKASGLSEDDVNQKIEDKQLELSGLVSPEGAAYIVGKELGVNLLKESPKRLLKIKNVVPGMRSVDVTGRIIRVSARKDFERDGRMKGVINVTLGDETGVLRLSLWDAETELVEKLDLNENEVINIRNGYVKENGRGDTEIRLGRMGRISKSDEKIPEVNTIRKDFEVVNLKSIANLKEEEYSEVKASLVQVFKRNPFFEVCPRCDSRLEKDGDAWKCRDHGKVEAKYNLVLSGVIDDGSGNIRVVFFRDMAEKVFGTGMELLRKIASENKDSLTIYDQIKLGKEFIIRGKIKKNQFTEKMELVANSVEDVNPKKEAEKMVQRIEGLRIKNTK